VCIRGRQVFVRVDSCNELPSGFIRGATQSQLMSFNGDGLSRISLEQACGE
jgi:hypothetical protein